MTTEEVIASLNTVIENQKIIKENQEIIKANQEKLDALLANQETIQANQLKILANQSEIISLLSKCDQRSEPYGDPNIMEKIRHVYLLKAAFVAVVFLTSILLSPQAWAQG
jgi:hypothetical protein